MRIDYSKGFEKALKKAPKKIQIAFGNRLRFFVENKFHAQLNNHALSGNLEGYRSINVTGDWCAVFREFNHGSLVYFDIFGTHRQLYGK